MDVLSNKCLVSLITALIVIMSPEFDHGDQEVEGQAIAQQIRTRQLEVEQIQCEREERIEERIALAQSSFERCLQGQYHALLELWSIYHHSHNAEQTNPRLFYAVFRKLASFCCEYQLMLQPTVPEEGTKDESNTDQDGSGKHEAMPARSTPSLTSSLRSMREAQARTLDTYWHMRCANMRVVLDETQLQRLAEELFIAPQQQSAVFCRHQTCVNFAFPFRAGHACVYHTASTALAGSNCPVKGCDSSVVEGEWMCADHAQQLRRVADHDVPVDAEERAETSYESLFGSEAVTAMHDYAFASRMPPSEPMMMTLMEADAGCSSTATTSPSTSSASTSLPS